MSAPRSTKMPRRVSEPRHQRGLIDTSVVIGIEQVAEDSMPAEVAVSAATLAELGAGPHATADPDERARRQDRLQRAEATFEPIPFDALAARAYGRVYAAALSAGREASGRCAVDLLIAATAVAAELPVYTRNPSDFAGLESIVEVVPVRPA
jgi:predicted nucleic acid-binding protein